MKISVNLTQDNFLPIECFSQYLSEHNHIYQSSHGNSKEQLVPFLYLVNSSHVEIKGLNIPERRVVFQPGADDEYVPTVSLPGIAFLLISSEPKVLFVFELFNDPFNINYEPKDCLYYVVQAVDRNCILHYRKDGRVKFHAVNPKNSDMIRHNSRRGPGGIIPGLLMKGVTSLTAKLEHDLKEKEGVKYTLSFMSDGEEAAIELVAELAYEPDFDAYLGEHWSVKEPEAPNVQQKGGGCYIATACYHSYDHPSVLVLRKFRDDVLLKNSFGVRCVNIYYKYSPFWAGKLRALPAINKLVRVLFLDPVVSIISKRKGK